MKSIYEKENKRLIFEIHEEIDEYVVQNMRRRLDNEIERYMPKEVIFDFNKVSFMDSAGIGLIIGKMVARAMDIGQRLQEKMDVEVINARFLKPLDDNTIIESIKKTKNVITIEDGTIINGLATAVKEVIVNNNLQGVKIKSYAYPDEFIKHGSVDELEKIYGLDEENIINGVNKS